MARIFLSYARADVDCARKLADLVARAGHDVWWDRELHGGSRFSTEIDKALNDAEAVIVLWSQSSLESAWVQDEAAEGRDSGRLVPATIDAVRPPLGFRQYQAVDLTDLNNGQQPERLEELLRAIVKMAAPVEPKPSRDAAPTKEEAAPKPSICVLPFANMSGEAEQEYFSDGISEDIITDLSKVSALSVIARNTAFMFKGQTVDVKDVAKTLGVSHVLEGSVRKAGDRVRITAQLIDGAKGDHIWADRFDRDLTDIFTIQDEISKAIVDALRLKLLPKEKSAIEARGTSSVEAYSLYLMARQQWIGGFYGDVRKDEAIVRLCKQATALDPDYAHAWALLALGQLELRFLHGMDVNALPAAERALEIDPNLPEAHCIKARYLEEEGRGDEAESQIRTALRLDPESWEVNREAARLIFRHDHIRDAIPYFEKAASLMDMDFNNPAMLITCYNAVGDAAKALAAAKVTLERAERTIAKDPTNCSALAMGASALNALGELERARDWVRRALLLDPENLLVRYNLACALALELGDPEGALEALQPFFEQITSTTMIRHLEVDPDLDPIRDDPRFKASLEATKQRLKISAAPSA
ncbi:TIR domain-containing protein [Sphingomonas sp. URHD0057]|uniref:TIR domain-containing protein n=1 Tax=Sphingomonas sp. URHD0057 TaxID=1380389 RepID=UPI000683FC82|nr:TIR domain-containing protein [Sphingomonas sp. URHD0057]